jgi:uncharacterized membrane protein YeaQ/YmgE (transglycosylase-associated protein family)
VTIESLIIFLIIGAVAGWLAGMIVKGFGFGLIGNCLVGIVGALGDLVGMNAVTIRDGVGLFQCTQFRRPIGSSLSLTHGSAKRI